MVKKKKGQFYVTIFYCFFFFRKDKTPYGGEKTPKTMIFYEKKSFVIS